MNNEEKILAMLENINSRLGNVEDELKSTNQRLDLLEEKVQFTSDNVVKIEITHGEKLGILLDRELSNRDFIGRCDARVIKLENGFERIDAEVAGLKAAQ